jgi:hypothetical protein
VSVDVQEMGTTASSMPGAGLYEPHDHGWGQQVRAGLRILLAVGRCHRGWSEPSVDFEEISTTASSMRLCEPHDHGQGQQVRAGPCLLLSGDAIVDVWLRTGASSGD